MSSLYCAWTWSNDPSTPSLYPEYNSLIKPITDEEFNSFHFIDRELFSRLIFNYGRDVIESVQVMAFWLWLERERYCPMKLVYKILRELPPHLVSQVADETVLCLKCIENDYFIYSVTDEDILLLQSLMEKKKIRLVELHENRMSIVSKITSLANEIGLRAFKDILQRVFDGPRSVVINPNQASGSGTSNRYLMPAPFRGIPVYPIQLAGLMGVPTGYLVNAAAGGGGGAVGVPPPLIPQDHPINPYELLRQLHHQVEDVNRELGERMSNVHISEHNPVEEKDHSEEVEVPADNRTIFLTFSKGYLITENEVREFFTRRYGDFIEAIFMQEVEPGEQSLFARVVCRSLSEIDRVVPGGSKAKFSISGKHVWARKYVKKTSKSPQKVAAAGASQSSG